MEKYSLSKSSQGQTKLTKLESAGEKEIKVLNTQADSVKGNQMSDNSSNDVHKITILPPGKKISHLRWTKF